MIQHDTKSLKNIFSFVLLLGLSFFPDLPQAESIRIGDGILKVSDAFIRATKGKNAAAYCKIQNTSSSYVTLIDAKPDPSVAKYAELHTHEQQGDIFRMVKVNHITIPPHQTIMLEPGGMHIMLMHVEKTLANGTEQRGPINLIFDNKVSIQLDFPVHESAKHKCGCKG